MRVDDPTPGIPTSSPDVTYSAAEPFTEKGNYSKLLPSFNVGFWLREDMLVRAAAAQVDIAALAQPAGADPHRRHARPHLRGVL